jgi:hypothetical protein
VQCSAGTFVMCGMTALALLTDNQCEPQVKLKPPSRTDLALQKVRRPRSQYSIFAGICICYYVDTKLPTPACRKCVRPSGVRAQERGQGDEATGRS